MNDLRTPQVSLPENLADADYYTTDPFTIFEIKNFVDDAFYRDLVEDVNSRQEFDRVFKKKGNKKKFSLGGHNIEDVENTAFTRFVRYFLSHEFYNWFARTHLPHFPGGGKPYYVYDKDGDDYKAAKKANKNAEDPFTFYNTEVHYSSIEKDGFIPPHTDSPRKRLSLVFYLPEEPVSDEMQENLGTVFYKAKPNDTAWERFESGLLNGKDTDKFLANHDVARTTTFEMNKVAGFIKSDISWHAVAPNAYDYDRRAIVINIMEMA